MNKVEILSKPVAQVLRRPLPWQEQGLSQTASGYGAKLTTPWKVRLEGEKILRRIYLHCYSNSGTAYIVSKGTKVILQGSMF